MGYAARHADNLFNLLVLLVLQLLQASQAPRTFLRMARKSYAKCIDTLVALAAWSTGL